MILKTYILYVYILQITPECKVINENILLTWHLRVLITRNTSSMCSLEHPAIQSVVPEVAEVSSIIQELDRNATS